MGEDKDDLHDLDAALERAAKLMVKAGYSAYSVKIKVAGKERRYGLMESSVYLRIIMARGKGGTPPTGPGPKAK